ncbi:hypothetical protein DEO72_LG11g1234 [Vigna unguiculata]|uniref:Uncharacterized protein n=1 Tax=Vigna unguiculata TaxID=3917 RepID=A0A4D6NPT0_VIGUN|nr:hypothetical protein DEO72_LG11g1234 [Vigna unguiculata]
MSRSGESLSPKREREECSVVGLTRSSGERFDFLGESDLAQARVTRLSEKSRWVLCVVLAQARIGVKHVAFYGLWPEMTSFELWLEIADEHEEP